MPGKRSNGEGSIRQRADGRWEGRIRIGQKRRTVYGKTRKEAADQLAQIRQEAMLGLTTAPSSETLESYLKGWLTRADHLRPTTAHLYGILVRVHIVPNIGHVKLKDLAPLHLNECYRRIKGKRTKEQVHRLLHKSLGDAVKLRLMTNNPASMLDVAVSKPAKKKRWTMEQARAFITCCRRFESRYDGLWLFQLATSCRIGEALDLEEDDVNWETSIVDIKSAIIRVGGEILSTNPKTEDSIRKLHVPEFGMQALRHQRQFCINGYFFRTKEGNVPWATDIQRRLREACFRAGVPEATSHDLRKMHASLAIAGGVDVKTVQKRLGHATLALTLGLYAEAMEEGDFKAAQALDTMLGHGSTQARSERNGATDD